jgi:hypothetical protein
VLGRFVVAALLLLVDGDEDGKPNDPFRRRDNASSPTGNRRFV